MIFKFKSHFPESVELDSALSLSLACPQHKLIGESMLYNGVSASISAPTLPDANGEVEKF